MSPTATLVGSEALSTALSPLTPVAPPADALMLSQPAPIGWHRTAGMMGVGAAAAMAARRADRSWLAGVSNGIACGPDIAAAALGPAVGAADDGDAVEDVMNGPVSSEQPFLQPVAAGPTNVGADGPMVVLASALARALLALPMATGALPSRPTSSDATTAGITHRRSHDDCRPAPTYSCAPSAYWGPPQSGRMFDRSGDEPTPGRPARAMGRAGQDGDGFRPARPRRATGAFRGTRADRGRSRAARPEGAAPARARRRPRARRDRRSATSAG